MKKVCYFDLETKYAFAEIEKGWESLTFGLCRNPIFALGA